MYRLDVRVISLQSLNMKHWMFQELCLWSLFVSSRWNQLFHDKCWGWLTTGAAIRPLVHVAQYWINTHFFHFDLTSSWFHLHPSCAQGGSATTASPIDAKKCSWNNRRVWWTNLFSSLLAYFLSLCGQMTHTHSPAARFWRKMEDVLAAESIYGQGTLGHTKESGDKSSFVASSRQELADCGGAGVTWTRERQHWDGLLV